MIITDIYKQYLTKMLEESFNIEPNSNNTNVLEHILNEDFMSNTYNFSFLCSLLNDLEDNSDSKECKSIYKSIHKSLHEANKLSALLN